MSSVLTGELRRLQYSSSVLERFLGGLFEPTEDGAVDDAPRLETRYQVVKSPSSHCITAIQ